jgi:class 3 adenylate cyclase
LRSLQVKFSALVVALLVLACVGLAMLATRHERTALVAEVEKRGRALVVNLAGAAKQPLLALGDGDFDPELSLDTLVRETGDAEGVVSARILRRDGTIVASLATQERGQPGKIQFAGDEVLQRDIWVGTEGSLLSLAAPIRYSDVLVGETQLTLDLRVLVDPVVQNNARQLSIVAVAVVLIGILAGVGFVALLVGPLRRLRAGVELLTAGDVTVRVPPTSGDEIGELTRAFNEMGDALEQKQRIQQAFGRYVDEHVLNQLLESGGDSEKQEGVERTVTVLFVDIRKFTRLSEGLDAQHVVALLNEVFQLISDIILGRGGTIDKFIGDSVMAYFGAPVPHADHSLRAVTAAIEIIRAIERRNAQLPTASGRDPAQVVVGLGIGIHSGNVVVGNIGSDRRTDFTAVGDAVNVASRLEKLAAAGQILVSEVVQRQVRGAVELRFEGERQLSGREEPVHVYSVDAEAGRARGLPSTAATASA